MTLFDDTFINSSKTSQNHCLPSDLTSHSNLLFPLKQGYFLFYFFFLGFSSLLYTYQNDDISALL